MSIKSDLVAHLKADGPLTAVIGQRVYAHMPNGLPQGKDLPALTYQQISGMPAFAYEGRLSASRDRFQFNAFARSPLEAEAAITAAIAALDSFPGNIQIEGPRDNGDPDTKLSFPSFDLIVWHN